MNIPKIDFTPKSLTSFLVAMGIVFIMISGLTIEISDEMSNFFGSWGKIILIIGLIGWAAFIIPAIIRNFSKL